MIGPNVIVTPEFTVYKAEGGYLLELDGADLGWDTCLAEIHKMAKAVAKAKSLRAPGLTEAFGRNRQFIQGPRGGWIRYKGAA